MLRTPYAYNITTLLTGQARTACPATPARRWRGRGAGTGAAGPGWWPDTALPTGAATARRTAPPGREAAARWRRRRCRPRPAPSPAATRRTPPGPRSEEHTSELQSRQYLVCRLLLEKKKKKN